MDCPYCNQKMTLGRITVLDRIDYRFYPEEKFKGPLRNATNKLFMTGGVRLDKIRIGNILGSEIENCYHCVTCKKIIIDIQDIE